MISVYYFLWVRFGYVNFVKYSPFLSIKNLYVFNENLQTYEEAVMSEKTSTNSLSLSIAIICILFYRNVYER